jgi:hypothetical protein
MSEVKYSKRGGELTAEQNDLLQSIKNHAHEEAYGVPPPEAPTPEPVDPAAEGDPDGIPVGFPTDPGHIFTNVAQYIDYRDRVLPERERQRAAEIQRLAEELAEAERQRRLRAERLQAAEGDARARLDEVKERVSTAVHALTKAVVEVNHRRDAARKAALDGGRGLPTKVNVLRDAFAVAHEAAERVERAHVNVAVAQAELRLASHRVRFPELGDGDFAIRRMEMDAARGRFGTAIPPTAAQLLINAGLPGKLHPPTKDLAGQEVADALSRLRQGLGIT